MGCSILGRGIGVNRLKRGGSLFEGIVQREMEEYIIRTICVRSGLPHLEGYLICEGCSQPRRALYGILRNGKTNRPTHKVSDHFTVGSARTSMSMGRVFIVDDEEHVRKTV